MLLLTNDTDNARASNGAHAQQRTPLLFAWFCCKVAVFLAVSNRITHRCNSTAHRCQLVCCRWGGNLNIAVLHVDNSHSRDIAEERGPLLILKCLKRLGLVQHIACCTPQLAKFEDNLELHLQMSRHVLDEYNEENCNAHLTS